MSESAPEPTPSHRQPSSPFLQKLGPLPLWAWMGVGLGVALAYYFWKQNKAKASSSTSSSGSSGSTGGTSTPGGTTTSSLIPQFVNQVYNEPSPPSDVTVNNNTTNTVASTPPPTAPRPTQQQPSYPAPSDFEGWKQSGTSIRLHWSALSEFYNNPNASYTWVVKDSAGNSKTGTTKGTDVYVDGLKPHTGYSIGVYATGGNGHSTGAPTYSYIET